MARIYLVKRPMYRACILGVLAVVGIGALSVAGLQAQDEAPDGVVNYTRVDATVACAGATPPEAMADLRAFEGQIKCSQRDIGYRF